VLLAPDDLIPYQICLAASGGDHRLLVTWDFYSHVGSFYGQLSFTLVWKIHQVGEFVLACLLVVAIVRKKTSQQKHAPSPDLLFDMHLSLSSHELFFTLCDFKSQNAY
jgi:hypothetical protein